LCACPITNAIDKRRKEKMTNSAVLSDHCNLIG
jgi:hypothetical protein